jgi:hypothetical protein
MKVSAAQDLPGYFLVGVNMIRFPPCSFLPRGQLFEMTPVCP